MILQTIKQQSLGLRGNKTPNDFRLGENFFLSPGLIYLWHQTSSEHGGNVASTGFLQTEFYWGVVFSGFGSSHSSNLGCFSNQASEYIHQMTQSWQQWNHRESPHSNSLKTSTELESAYPWNIEVRHQLLEGPGLLCLLLVVQGDLLAELPGVGATCARGAGHRAGRSF